MLRKGMRTSSIFNSQHAATRRNMVAKRVQHVAPNSVAICCVEMLQSFGQGLDRPFARSGHMVRNKLCCEVNNVDCEQSLSFLSVFLAFLILELALSYRVASPNLHNIREVKLDVYYPASRVSFGLPRHIGKRKETLRAASRFPIEHAPTQM